MRYCSELISKIIAEEMEKILAAFEVIGEAFSTAFDIGLLGWAEACEAIQTVFGELEDVAKVESGTPPKKYGMSLRKCQRRTEVGIVKTFGKVDHTVSGGLNFVNPISDTVEVMDLRVHVNEASFASYTKDAQPLTAAIEYQYEPIATQAMQIVSQYGSYEILETKLQAAVEERAKIVFARYGAMTLLENRATLSAQVQEEVKELEELFPVNFTQVVVKDIDFSDAFEQAVEAKMQAEQNALRAENEKQEAITRAEQEREVARVEAEAAVLAAEGEARALEITREALENMPDTWIAQQYLEKWDGKLPQLITGDGSGLMLTPNLE